MGVVNVLGYARVSTQRQYKEGYSLASQQDEIEAFCNGQSYHLVDILTDGAKSGASVDEDDMSINRPGLQETLVRLKPEHIKFVVVVTTSRLWRSDIVKALIHRELRRANTDVKAIDRPTYSIYSQDPNDRLVNGMMELLDEYERLEIALKLGRGRIKKASLGGYAGGGAPLGYSAQLGHKRLEVAEDEAGAVQRSFELHRAMPELTLQNVADILNLEGYRTKRGCLFTPVQVKRIYDREEFYSGLYRYAGQESPGQYEPLLVMG